MANPIVTRYHRLGTHRGARRLYLQGREVLCEAGFKQGVRYQARTSGDTVTLRLSPAGAHRVSQKPGGVPVIDHVIRSLGDVDRVIVTFSKSAITVSLHPTEAAARARLARLNGRLAAGQPLRLGSLSHGGGVATEALSRGLKAAGVASHLDFAVDIDEDYLLQARANNPAWSRSTRAIAADLGEVAPSLLGQTEILEAGLPCVAASRAGKSKKGLAFAEQDPQVTDLANAFLEIVREVQPAVIVLENVTEYADSASALQIRARLSRWGYDLHERTIEGGDWALENRRRWVLIAVTSGLAIDLDALVPTSDRPATLGEVLDRRVSPDRWGTTAGKDAKEARDLAKGNGFKQQWLTPASTSVPVLRRGYQKNGSTDPRLVHPTRPGVSRLLTPAEHARVKGIPAQLVRGCSDKVAHQILGQSVIAPAFASLGALIGKAVAA